MITKEVTVLQYLLDHKETEININQLSKGLHMNYKNMHMLVDRLWKKGILQIIPFGNTRRIILVNTAHPLIFQAEYQRKQEMIKNRNLQVLVDYFDRNMLSKFYILLLFGSYVKNAQTKHSDIDLLFIVPNDSEITFEKNINDIAALLPLKLHINIFKEKDFVMMKDSKKTTIGSEAIKKNIILHGIEAYYGLI